MTDRVTNVVRRGGVAKITFLSGDSLRVPSPLYLERRLRTGEDVDLDDYRAFIRRRAGEHALNTAAKYMETRERSAGEIAAHLKGKAYDEDVIQNVLAVLKGRSLVSDTRFAEMWSEARLRRYGRGRIAQELSRKGVSRETIASTIQRIDPDIELSQAAGQAEKLLKRTDEKKAMAALLRRGYSYAVARQAILMAGEQDSE